MARKGSGNEDVRSVVTEILTQAAREAEEQSQQRKEVARYGTIYAKLEELGGKLHHDDDITYEGDKFVLPKGMSLQQGERFLARKREEEENVTVFRHVFNYRPYDGAWCMWNAMKKHFGAVGHKERVIKTMFGNVKEPPAMISIPTGVAETDQVPWGNFTLPFLPGAEFETHADEHPEKGYLFAIMVESPKKHRFAIEGIFNLVEKELKENSLYRGKAFDGQHNPEFIDLAAVDPRRVVYSNEVLTQLEANVWAQLRHTEEFERVGIPLKRAVLLHGPFGTGKTLAALLTGQEAVKAGWTFIKARPGRDDIFTVMSTARLYEPCVVFYEDVDQIADVDESDRGSITQLLDVFDGIEAKGTKILCVLTTNYPEKITKGMARPGRLDAMIEINELDQDGVRKLCLTRLDETLLADDIDWGAVFEASQDYKPAFVTEFADRTMRYVIAKRGTVDGAVITTTELVDAARGLRPQYERMVGAKEVGTVDPLGEQTKKLLAETLHENLKPAVIQSNGH